MKMPENVNIKPEVALAFGLGTAAGTTIMALIARKGVHDLVELSSKQHRRQHETIKFMMAEMGPHVPTETLSNIILHMSEDLLVIQEEGLEMGVAPTQE